MKSFIDKDICSRTTGGYKDSNTTNFWSHFDVNFIQTPDSEIQNSGIGSTTENSGIGVFPYEKPWSINYPEPYKIPTMPVKKRFDYDVDRTFGTGTNPGTASNPYILEEPAYEDGDLIGNIVGDSNGEVAGGFGVQIKAGTWFPNQIAYVATKNYMYKYEKDVRWNETYTNGFEPIWTQGGQSPYPVPYNQLAGMSSVNNGEKYQRVECGYGYFMKYIDWPRVFRASWSGDIYFEPDDRTVPGVSEPNIYAPLGGPSFKTLRGWVNNCYNLDDQNFAFAFNQTINGKTNSNTIDIYRIVNSGLDNIKIPETFVIKTSVVIVFGGHADMCHALTLKSTGTIDVKMINTFNATIQVINPSEPATIYYVGDEFTLKPEGVINVMETSNVDSYGNQEQNTLESEIQNTSWNFPGNDGFNTSTNKYEVPNYRIIIQAGWKDDGYLIDYDFGNFDQNGTYSNVPNSKTIDFSDFNSGSGLNAKVVPDQLYINSIHGGGDNGYNIQGISSWNLPADNDHKLRDITIESTPGAASA